MDSESKRQKSIEEDRISNLPTSLISHILSLLPTKYAVRTSSLSTFWNQQWTSITQIRFDDALTPTTSSTRDTKASFFNFVYRVLLHLKVASLDVFQLNCSQDYGVAHINSWVSAALSRNVQQIDLSISMDVPGLLPRSLFSSTNLVVLKLGTGFLLKVPMLISLDSLKILHLAVKFSDNGSLSRILSSCPVLEELKLQGSLGNNVNKVKISSIALKRLILIGLNPHSEPQSHSCSVVLRTPGLQYFEHLDSRVPYRYYIGIIHCLDRARIDVEQCYDGLLSVETLSRAHRSMASLAVGISSIKFLYLSKDACKALSLIHRKLPKFPRLIELELEETHWRFLEAFLESSPKLATLSFQYSFYYHGRKFLSKHHGLKEALLHKNSTKLLCDMQKWSFLLMDYADLEQYPPRSVPLCMLSDLKQIEIKNFQGQPKELDIVRDFLEKSKCLNKLLISYSWEITSVSEAYISKKLLMLPRASSSCVVVIT